jgi:hypothetical protein
VTGYIASSTVMDRIDRMPRAMRALVREYGYVIVNAMMEEGYRDPFELAELLETWRVRRQDEWLATNFITRKTAQSIADAVQYRMAARSWPSRM